MTLPAYTPNLDEIRQDGFRLIDHADQQMFRSPKLEFVFSYWRALSADGLPRRIDIDAFGLKPVLPNIMLIELSNDPFRVKYRLVGTEVVKFTGFEFTGEFLDQLEFDTYTLNEIANAYRSVQDNRRPGVGTGAASWSTSSVMRLEYLICPLSDDGIRINQCLVCEDYLTSQAFNIAEMSMILRRKNGRAPGTDR